MLLKSNYERLWMCWMGRQAMEDFLPSIEFEHMGVGDFLHRVVPANPLTPGIKSNPC